MWCQARFESTADATAFWQVASSDAGMLLFKGFGMVPGIRAVQPLGDGTHQILNTDGTRHRERAVTRDACALHLEIDQFEGAGSSLFMAFSERWRLDPNRRTIQRHFQVTPQPGLAARVLVGALIRPQLLVAMKRNMQAIAKAAGVGMQLRLGSGGQA